MAPPRDTMPVMRRAVMGRKRDATRLHYRPDRLLAHYVLGDAVQQEIGSPLSPLTLPHGQLLLARSPCRKAEEEHRLAKEISSLPSSTFEVGQHEGGKRCADRGLRQAAHRSS